MPPAQSADEKLFIARMEDMARLAASKGTSRFTNFLNMREMGLLKSVLSSQKDMSLGFYGGFDDAERCIGGVWPLFFNVTERDFPLSVLRVELKSRPALTHRIIWGRS